MVKVKDIMKRNVITAEPNLNMSDVAKIMTNNRVGSVVVMNKDKPIGMVTNDDVVSVVAGGKSLKNVRIRDVPKRRKNLVIARPDDSVMDVAKRMLKTGIKRMPVISQGKLMGIVSDKEILLVSPELINIMSEKLKIRVDRVADPTKEISGICENCESYSDHLVNQGGRWVCEDCK